MYELNTSTKFDKQYKKIAKTKDKAIVDNIIIKLLNEEPLERKYNDHALKGDFIGCRECHIKPDLLLVYQKIEDILTLTCLRLGSHSELF